MSDNRYLNRQEFVENTAKRIPVCIVVDCSWSMHQVYEHVRRIDRVNDGIKLFYEQTQKDIKTRKAVETCIISVADSANVIQNFASTEKLPNKLIALNESGDLVLGVKLAIEKLDERKKLLLDNGVDYYQPWLIIMSDGRPTRKKINNKGKTGPGAELKEFQNEIRFREERGKLVVFPVCITDLNSGTKSYNKGLSCMGEFTNDKRRLITFSPDSSTFKDLFEFLHKSASSVASGNGFLKSSNSKFGDYTSLNKQFNIQKSIKNAYDFEEDCSSSSRKVSQEETLALSQEEMNNKSSQDAERIKKLREEAKTYKAKANNIEEKNEIQNNYVMFVNDEKIYPIRSTNTVQTILMFTLHNGDEVKIFNNSDQLNINGYKKYKASKNAEYKFFITNNDIIKVEIVDDKPIISPSNVDSLIDKEINELLSTIVNWDII